MSSPGKRPIQHFGFGLVVSGVGMIIMWSLYSKESTKDLDKQVKERFCQANNAGPYDKDGKLDWKDTADGRRCLLDAYHRFMHGGEFIGKNFDIEPTGVCKGLGKSYKFRELAKAYKQPEDDPPLMCNSEKVEELKKRNQHEYEYHRKEVYKDKEFYYIFGIVWSCVFGLGVLYEFVTFLIVRKWNLKLQEDQYYGRRLGEGGLHARAI